MQPQTPQNLFRKAINPTLKEVQDVCWVQGLTDDDAEELYDHYSMQGWYRANGQPICDLVGAVKMWRRNKPKYESPEQKLKRWANE